MNPVFSSLRQQGHLPSSYIDDSLLVGSNYTECASNDIDAITLAGQSRFCSSPKKRVSFHTHTNCSILGVCFELNPYDSVSYFTQGKQLEESGYTTSVM